jgi:VanZ family protein
MGVIFFMSSLPGYEVPEMPFRFGDKFVHALEFGLLGMFLYHFFRYPRPLVSHPWLGAVIVGVLYAASDEIHQLFVPGRMCDIMDFMVDCIGLVFFSGISARLNPLPRPEKSLNHGDTEKNKEKKINHRYTQINSDEKGNREE